MRTWPTDPVVHEIFTWVWLADLSREHGRTVTLATVPDDVWDDVARPGVDAVWLMGVWQRSPIGAAIARSNPAMRSAHREALTDLTDEDVVGSAYCVRDYRVDDRLGGDQGLAIAREQLAGRGVRLVLDLVPNHVAPDHPWVHSHPEYFVHGTPDDLANDSASFLDVDGQIIACGRDPYFPAWPEVVQLDTSHAGTRVAMAELVVSLTERCDALRCDMAMLVLDDVFWRTWGERASGGPLPDQGRGFWPTVIDAAKAVAPDFVMWAEAYWDLEPVLLDQGFDACYDKRLYDKIVHLGPVPEVRAHLSAPIDQQQRSVRFVENHDEPRAAAVLTAAAHRAALVAVLTLPGVALLHEGEADERKVRVPVTLGRRPIEEPDAGLRAHVDSLLAALAGGMRRGRWALAQVDGWPDNTSAERLLAWSWTLPERRWLVAVNLTAEHADGCVLWPWQERVNATVVLVDAMSGDRYERNGVMSDGLYVALDGFGVHLFEVSTEPFAPSIDARSETATR